MLCLLACAPTVNSACVPVAHTPCCAQHTTAFCSNGAIHSEGDAPPNGVLVITIDGVCPSSEYMVNILQHMTNAMIVDVRGVDTCPCVNVPLRSTPVRTQTLCLEQVNPHYIFMMLRHLK